MSQMAHPCVAHIIGSNVGASSRRPYRNSIATLARHRDDLSASVLDGIDLSVQAAGASVTDASCHLTDISTTEPRDSTQIESDDHTRPRADAEQIQPAQVRTTGESQPTTDAAERPTLEPHRHCIVRTRWLSYTAPSLKVRRAAAPPDLTTAAHDAAVLRSSTPSASAPPDGSRRTPPGRVRINRALRRPRGLAIKLAVVGSDLTTESRRR